jgi:inhibitor of KinA
MNITQYSENTVTVYLGNEIDEDLNRQLVQLKNFLDDKGIDGVEEIIVSYTSLIVNFNILKITSADIIKIIESVDMAALLRQPFKYNVVEIPVCYEGEYGPDISRFKENGLSAEEVINLHSHQEYLVYMLGFMPGFPYLGGLDQKLHKERLETPRTRVPKGAVGIGGEQTGMYPFESPGGWNLIGNTPIPLFDPERKPTILYGPGDRIIFKPIDKNEYKDIERAARLNQYEVHIYEGEES